MRIGRAILIPAILMLGLAGSAVPGPGMALAAGLLPGTAHVTGIATVTVTGAYYHS